MINFDISTSQDKPTRKNIGNKEFTFVFHRLLCIHAERKRWWADVFEVTLGHAGDDIAFTSRVMLSAGSLVRF